MEKILKKKFLFIVALVFTMILIPLNYIEAKFFYANLPLKMAETLLGTGIFSILLLFSKTKDFSLKDCPLKTSLKTGTILLFSVFSAYKIIYFYTQNITKIPFLMALGFILTFMAAFWMLFWFFKTIFNNDLKAVIPSLVIVLAVSLDFSNADMSIAYISGAIFISIALLTLFNIEKLISFLKYFISAILILCVLNSLYTLILPIFLNLNQKPAATDSLTVTKNPKRDVYIILLDAYAGKRGLNAIGFDNSFFMNELKNRGFKVYEDIESNYHRTVLSIPSFLNADYIEDMPYKTPAEAASSAKIFKLAKQTGYTAYYINSWPMDFTITDDIVDYVYNSTQSAKADIARLFIGNTLLSVILNKENKTDAENFQSILDRAGEIINKKGPKRFVFAHFLMPHIPYIYNDEALNPEIEYWDIPYHNKDAYKINKEGYIGFLKYTNKRTLRLLDEIFAQNREKPIVIVMGDHGLRMIEYVSNTRKYEWEFRNYYKYYFNTFLAYYNPEMEDKYYKNPKSLINFSRGFFNEIFGTNRQNVDDKHFFIPSDLKTFEQIKTIEAEY